MQAFDLIKMQLLKIILLLSVFALSSVLATGMLRWGFFFTSVLRFAIKGLDSRTKQLFFYQSQCSDVHNPLFSAVMN